ncbi:hypothetical protein [Evansella tamaricis]|uniref:Uncharacterized protein n=1 Tax=Evansella tamaricis TaxID=2069301 RepID=A0ABS6JQ73_9BACI|nr:hypothetical protein [Evansella tamaricis]MBU9714443.1 hypothetical protein [Evansella tamaricis]
MGWTEAEKKFYSSWKGYEFDNDPWKYREHKRPKELKTVDQIRDELIAAGKIKPKKKRKKKIKKMINSDIIL